TGGLGGDFAVAAVHGFQDEGSVALDVELARVAAGSGLGHGHGLLHFGVARVDDLQLGVELVDELIFEVDGVHRDVGLAVLHLGAQVVAGVDLLAHRGADDLGPELAVVGPTQPIHGPAVLDVAGPGDAGAGADPPAGEQG